MLLTNRLWWSKCGRFILSLGLKKKENRIVLQFQVVQLDQEILQNQALFQSYYNNYLADRNNLYFLTNLSKVVTVFKQDYKFEELKMIVEGLKRLDKDDKRLSRLDFGNGIVIVLDENEIEEIIGFIESFYRNYNILDAVSRLVVDNIGDEKRQETVSNLKLDITKPKVAVEKEDQVKVQDEAEENLEYLLTQLFVIKQFLIHIFLTYYIYLDSTKDETEIATKIVRDNDSNNATTTIEIVNPFKVIQKFNPNYESLFILRLLEIIPICVKEIDFEIATYSIKEIVDNLIEKYQDNLSIQLLLMLQLFIFCVVKVYHENQTREPYSYVMSNLSQVINNQNQLLDKFLNYCLANSNTEKKIKIRDIDFKFEIQTGINRNKIDQLIEKHSNLKMIDEEKFLKAVLKDYEKENEENGHSKIALDIGSTKIIDIEKIVEENEKVTQPTIVINEKLDVKNDLLCYQKGEYITELYKEYLDYLNDETSILIKINDQNVDPTKKSIYKIFPLIKQFIQNNKIFNSKLRSTLDLYVELTKSSEFRDLCKVVTKNRLLLVIIYQILVPYFYHTFKQRQFVDNLL